MKSSRQYPILAVSQEQGRRLEAGAQEGGLEVLASLVDEWRELLERTPGPDPYGRPEWVLAHLRTHSTTAKVVALTCRQNGGLCAVLPLTFEIGTLSGIPVRKLRVPLPVAGAGTELALAPGVDENCATQSLWEVLKRLSGWDVLELPSVYEKASIERLFQAAQSDGYHTSSLAMPVMPYVTLREESGRACDTEKLPPNARLRSHLRQTERELSAMGRIRLQRFETADPAILRRFYELEASGWKGKEKSAILDDPRRQQFFSEVAKEAERLNCLSLYFLELEGRLLSAHFGFVYDQRYYAPKIAYDEAYSQYSPGHLIVREILRECVQRGISEYSMGMHEEWKMRWTKQVRTRTFRRIFNKGLWARIPFTVCFQIKPVLKTLLRR